MITFPTLLKAASSLPIIMLLFFLTFSTAEACERGNCQEAQAWGSQEAQPQQTVPAVAPTSAPTPTPMPIPAGPFWGSGASPQSGRVQGY